MCFPIKELKQCLGALESIKKLALHNDQTEHKCTRCNGVIKTKVIGNSVSGKCQQCGYSFGPSV